MEFTYRSVLVNQSTHVAKNITTILDTEKWIDWLKSNSKGAYGNTAEIVESTIIPALESNDQEKILGTLHFYDQQWYKVNKMIIFELALYTWAGYKKGTFSAETWATVLSVAWQSGSRGMMAAVKLSPAQVIDFFKSAPLPRLLTAAEFEGENLNEIYDNLPETIEVYRGVSTGMAHLEDGFSWTRDIREAHRFSALNCQNKKEIPGIYTATIPKSAVLAIFSYEGEVVVDPTIKKLKVEKNFLKGKDLREFHKRVDVDANTEDVIFQTGYAAQKKNLLQL